jgi:hypothetical protein
MHVTEDDIETKCHSFVVMHEVGEKKARVRVCFVVVVVGVSY